MGATGRGLDHHEHGIPVALVVEDDTNQRQLLGAIFEESEVEVIECETAEAAVEAMEKVGERAVFVFSDVRLPGAMDGVDLACEVGKRWPRTRCVTTSGASDPARLRALPKRTRHIQKPWRALDVIMELERAIAAR